MLINKTGYMVKQICFLISITLSIIAANMNTVLASPPAAKQIAEAMIYRNDGDLMYRHITMLTCRYQANGNKRRCMSNPQKKNLEALDMDTGAEKKDSLELGIIIEPIDERSMAFLQKDYDAGNREADQWMYFPALKKLKRIISESPNSPKTGSVFGSEISYEDNERMQLEDYNYTYLREQLLDGQACHVIEALPTKIRIPKSSYNLQKIWIAKQSSVPLKRELYDKHTGKLSKTIYLKNIEQHGEAWIARMQIVVNHLSGRMTLVRVDGLAINISLDQSMFELRALEDSAYREVKMREFRRLLR